MSICTEEGDFGEDLIDKNTHKKDGSDVDSSVFLSCFSSNSTLEKQDMRDNDFDKIIGSIAGQDNPSLYSWDISEDPNVVLKQSQIEEFIMSCLKTEEGMPEQIYKETVKYFGHCISARFKKTVLNKTHFCKIDQSIKYVDTIPP